MTNDVNFARFNECIKRLIEEGIVKPNLGVAKPPLSVVIMDMNKHAMRHGVTKEEAQGYINNAIVMFDQIDRALYVSSEGNAAVLNKELRVISAYGKENFDYSMKKILEVIYDDE